MIPTNFRSLVDYLAAHPAVRITGPSPKSREPFSRDETFLRYEGGRLWFRSEAGDQHIPIGCVATERAARAETGIEYDATGFTITKFGTQIRVEYLPCGVPAMTRVYYEIGHEHGIRLLSLQTLDALADIGSALEPGSYWIDRVTVRESWDPEEGWVYRRLYEPHGKLDVTGPGHWHFAALAGAEMGPGYVIV